MNSRCPRAAVCLAVLLFCLVLPTGVLWAQNENETIGFQSNHIFESGQFGENIDILNGGLNLTVPIGPRYQVNANLGYQLNLKYNSKVWDIGLYGTMPTNRTMEVLPYNESPVGLGFSLNFGRIFVESRYIENWLPSTSEGKTYSAGWIQTWKWVDQDGTQHDIYTEDFVDNPNPEPDNVNRSDRFHPIFNERRPTDLSYVLISGPSAMYCTDGGATSCFRVETPDGLVHTLSKRMECADPHPPQGAPPPLGPDDAKDPLRHAMYQSYCGWYTTRIEDRSVVAPEGQSPHYPVFVSINYSNTLGYEHTISSISDSTGRATTFSHCQWQAEPSTPPSDPAGDDIRCAGSGVPYNIHAIALAAIELPSFGNTPASGNTPAFTSDKAMYRFVYRFESIKRANMDFQNNAILTNDPVLKLVRLDYPPYLSTQGIQSLDRYSMYFKYMDNEGTTEYDYGELTCRTLPIGRVIDNQVLIGNPCEAPDSSPGPTRFRYHYDYYVYAASYLSSGRASKHVDCAGVEPRAEYVVDGMEPIAPGTACGGTSSGGGAGLFTAIGFSRQMKKKSVVWASGGPTPAIWNYDRGLTHLTNPSKVTVSDPFGNDTVYWFHASASGGAGISLGDRAEDGYAPEWNDGTNYKIDYYEGGSTGGRLVRCELQEHDADRDSLFPTKHSKRNVRVKKTTTQYVDDGGRSSVVAREDWDNISGHWLTEIESGFEVPAPRVTQRRYGSTTPTPVYRTDRLRYEEVSDGGRVVSRTDYAFDGNGRVERSVARATLPGAAGMAGDVNSQPGDVTTTYTYSSYSGNVLTKSITTGIVSDHGYAVKYTYAPAWPACPAANASECGGYLASKEFVTPGTMTPAFTWKAIERGRDTNTGLVVFTRDPSGHQVNYEYDSLGRITAVRPFGEDATTIDYVSLLETTVTQGTRTTDLDPNADFVFTRYLYDGLGRQVVTMRRPSDPTPDQAHPTDQKYACEKTQYDVNNRVLFKTEWEYLATCSPLPVPPPNQCWAFGVDFAQDPGTEFDFRDPGANSCDPFGRVRLTIPPDSDRLAGEPDRTKWSKVTRTDYFGTSSQVRVNSVVGSGGTVTFSQTTAYLKDALGRLTTVDVMSGRRCSVSNAVCTTDVDCGASGGTCVTTDGGADAHYDYDVLDRLVQVNLSDNLSLNQTRRFTYDGLGHVLSAEHPESGTTVYTAYDALGNPLALQDARGNVTRLVYDLAGRSIEQRVQAPGVPEKLVTRNTFDEDSGGLGHGRGKLTKIETFNEGGQLQLTEIRAYDGLGARLSLMTHIFSDWTQTNTNTLYSYNTRGQLATLGYPRESTPPIHGSLDVNYAYANGSVITATQAGYMGVQLGRVTYNAAGGVESVETPSGGKTLVTFDSRNRPASVTAGKWGTTDFTRRDYESGAFAYDGAGNIYQMGNSRYGYDAAGRLITAKTVYPGVNQYDETFSYDVYGNMMQRQLTTVDPGVTETELYTFSTPRTNRVMTRQTTFGSSTASSVDFLYDASGNVLQGGRRWNPGLGEQIDLKKYSYGALNRLLTIQDITNATTGTVAPVDYFGYDSSGNRIWKQKIATGIKTYYLRDPSGQVLSEFRRVASQTDRPEWTSDYVYLAGRLLSLKENMRPEPPRGLIASQTKYFQKWTINLTWNDNTEPDKSNYIVYRKRIGTDPDFVAIGTPPLPAYTDSLTYVQGLTIQYKVSCMDTSGYESIQSAIVVVSGDNNTSPPSAPTLSAAPGDGQVSLTFASSDNAGILGFYVYRGLTTPPQTQITPQLVPGPAFVDLILANNTTYYYAVKAKDTSGNLSASSPVVSVTPRDLTPPAPPKGLQVASTCDALGTPEQVRLTWDKNALEDGVVSYEVYRGSQPDVLALLSTIAAMRCSISGIGCTTDAICSGGGVCLPIEPFYSDPNVSVGTIYFYAVKAVDASSPIANRSPLSQVVAGTVRDSSTTPQVQMFAESSDGAVNIHWQPALEIGTPSSGPFRLYRKLNATDSCVHYVQIASVSGASGEYTDTTVPNNAAYDYALTAVTGNSESFFSKPVVGIPLDRPSNLYQCYGWGYFFPGNYLDAATVLQWTPPNSRFYQPLLATTADGTLAYLKGYHLYHHKRCGLMQGGSFNYKDDSPTREVVVDPTNVIDPYLLDRQTSSDGIAYIDPRYPVFKSYGLPLSPPFQGISTDAELFEDCGVNLNVNCSAPRAVYKVYAEGTWLTVESDWPDHFDPFEYDINLRCGNYLKHPDPLPLCTDSAANPNHVPSPTNLSATPSGPGAIRLSWTPPTIASGKPRLAGFHLYARDTALPQYSFHTPLPFATVGPGETSVVLTGLGRYANNYTFRVAAFDEIGRASIDNTGVQALPGAETVQPGPPASLHSVLWTVNDAVYGRGRGGIKIGWKSAEYNHGSSSLLGFRVYRSTTKEGPYCALLDNGQRTIALPPQVGGLCASDVPGRSIDDDAMSPDFSSAGGFYWDRAAAQDRVYYYRVAQLEYDGTNRETPFESTYMVAGKALAYDAATLPPPQGFRAWAPQQPNPGQPDSALESDRKGIYLRWCKTPSASDLPAVKEYRIYRRRDNVSTSPPYRLLARLSPACLDTDANGTPISRCVIDSSNWCADNNDVVQMSCLSQDPIGPVVVAPGCSTTTGVQCAIVDLTANCWPRVLQTASDNAVFDRTYLVTVVSTTDVESMPSNQDHGWLNYCAVETSGSCPSTLRTPCDEHRDPDGNGDYLVCGDENARLAPAESDDQTLEVPEPSAILHRIEIAQSGSIAPTSVADGSTPATRAVEPQVPSNADDLIAPHRTIGQSDPGVPSRFLFFHLDHLGSVRVVLDDAANLVVGHNYLPFGEERPVAAPPANPTINTKHFTGHERDGETGLDYMVARYYSSSLGRFMAVDPLMSSADPRNPQTWNRYTYALNNPLVLIDPLGLYSVDGPNKDQFNQQTSDTIGMPVYEDENGNMQRAQGPAAPGTEAAVAAFDAASAADFTIHADSGSDVAIDSYDTQTVNPGQIGALPSSAPAGSPQSSTQGEVVTHILAEYTAGSASGFAQGSFPAAHERGMEAQNQYRAGRGQVAVTSTETSRTKNMLFRPLTGNFRTVDFNRADGGRTRVTIQQAGWFTPAGVTVE